MRGINISWLKRLGEEMLKYTDHSPDEVLAIVQPSKREATPWSVAVNGVMAGCRPACMPVLIALIEAIGEPRFGLQHAGSTAGWTPLIILNGPIIKELNFNSGQGVLRPQRQANVTVSRFLRLAMMNLAGYQIGTTDLACFGTNYLPVLAEAEEESPYEPQSVERGFAKGSNVITVLSCLSMSYHFTSQRFGISDILALLKLSSAVFTATDQFNEFYCFHSW